MVRGADHQGKVFFDLELGVAVHPMRKYDRLS